MGVKRVGLGLFLCLKFQNAVALLLVTIKFVVCIQILARGTLRNMVFVLSQLTETYDTKKDLSKVSGNIAELRQSTAKLLPFLCLLSSFDHMDTKWKYTANNFRIQVLLPQINKQGIKISEMAKQIVEKYEINKFYVAVHDVSSELRCPGAKLRRWAPPLVTHLGVISRV